MKIYRFQGNSDDTFGEYYQTCNDYSNCGNRSPVHYELKTPDGAGVLIVGCYVDDVFNKGGGWMIGVSILDEEKPLTNWGQFLISPDHQGYRNSLIVEAPDNAELTCLNKQDQRDQ